MRFIAPPRERVPAACFGHPVFAEYQPWRHWLQTPDWPALDALADPLAAACRAAGIRERRVVEQDAELLACAQHYELHIAEGRLPTRARNWHDLLNALVWLRHPRLKQAMNQRQVQDIARMGPRERSRGQCALTHFDEAGVLLVLSDPGRAAAWDRHDWRGLFAGLGDGDYALAVIGHALLEHALDPQRLLVGKALLVLDPDPRERIGLALEEVSRAIGRGELLQDPQELRPLPLMGLPGWHAQAGRADFLSQAPCFQPLRAGRSYPPPIRLD